MTPDIKPLVTRKSLYANHINCSHVRFYLVLRLYEIKGITRLAVRSENFRNLYFLLLH